MGVCRALEIERDQASHRVAFAASRLSDVLGFMSLSGSHDASRISGFVMFRAAGAFGTVFSGVGLGGYLTCLIIMPWSHWLVPLCPAFYNTVASINPAAR